MSSAAGACTQHAMPPPAKHSRIGSLAHTTSLYKLIGYNPGLLVYPAGSWKREKDCDANATREGETVIPSATRRPTTWRRPVCQLSYAMNDGAPTRWWGPSSFFVCWPTAIVTPHHRTKKLFRSQLNAPRMCVRVNFCETTKAKLIVPTHRTQSHRHE